MKYRTIESYQTGVAVPLSGLLTRSSCGVGEFADLVPLARWVVDCGMHLIQLLPINDTGEERSPYSALSAFALHPVYIRLTDLPLSPELRREVIAFAKEKNGLEKIAWLDTVRFKHSVLKRHFDAVSPTAAEDPLFAAWIEQNDWVKPYAVFSLLKRKEGMKGWQEWSQYRNPTSARIESIWEKERSEAVFYAWSQYIAEQQMASAVRELARLGVMLKGDIPILLSEDSADVWSLRKLFDLSNRAGAPPDMFCYSGQNWRFPAYRWSVIEKENYGWWRARLRTAAKFYNAYRIDHVLGFFRIWQVPEAEHTGILGRFVPALPLRKRDFIAAGFTEATLDHLTDPTFSDQVIEEALQGTGSTGEPWLVRGPGGWKINRDRLSCEADLLQSDEPQPVKDALISLYWDRVLLRFDEVGEDFHPHWYWYQSRTLQTLPESEQQVLRELIDRYHASQEPLWTDGGRKILSMMQEETDMLVCAEDLGVVPPCVPRTLEEMGILGLKIERWTRDWEEEGQPWIPVSEYPRLSVCSPGTHDTSSLRGYWEETTWPRDEYAASIGLSPTPDYLTEEACEIILRRNLDARSLLAVIPLQDWLALRYERRSFSPEEERINTPGSLDPVNWTWRMVHPLEDVDSDLVLKEKIRALVRRRTDRALE